METPTHIELVRLWMATHFKGIPCAVFFDPLGNGERIALFKDRLGITCGTQLGAIIASDIFIVPLEDPNSVVNGLGEDEWGYVAAWNGHAFTTENT